MTLEHTTAAAKRQKTRRQLVTLLDGVERGNKRDAADYTGGYLNEQHLYTPHEIYGHQGWPAAQIGPLKKPSSIPVKSKSVEPKESRMMEVLTDFSMGNDSLLPSVKRGTGHKSKRKHSIDDHALIEELDANRIMLTRSQPTRLQRSWALEDERTNSPPQPNHKFLSLQTGATKKDQLRDFKSFEKKMLRKHETMEKNVFSGKSAVIDIELKLNKELDKLGSVPGTTFHRLQAHSDAMDELNSSSTTFGYLLKIIKGEYDDYMSWLLDNNPARSQVLKEQVGQLHESGVSNPKQLSQAKKEVEKLERQGKELLEENDKLRAQLTKAREDSLRYHSPDLYSKRQVAHDNRHLDLAGQLQDLHSTILERLDKLDDIRSSVREDYVPSNVCHNLEQCLKDTEIEIQKLLKQNEIMQGSIDEMEETITSSIDECDVSSRDRQKCLEKVTRVRLPGLKKPFTSYDEYKEFMVQAEAQTRTNLYNPLDEGESSEEEDEAQTRRWDWYIS